VCSIHQAVSLFSPTKTLRTFLTHLHYCWTATTATLHAYSLSDYLDLHGISPMHWLHNGWIPSNFGTLERFRSSLISDQNMHTTIKTLHSDYIMKVLDVLPSTYDKKTFIGELQSIITTNESLFVENTNIQAARDCFLVWYGGYSARLDATVMVPEKSGDVWAKHRLAGMLFDTGKAVTAAVGKDGYTTIPDVFARLQTVLLP
jgi:hypothetical protein